MMVFGQKKLKVIVIMIMSVYHNCGSVHVQVVYNNFFELYMRFFYSTKKWNICHFFSFYRICNFQKIKQALCYQPTNFTHTTGQPSDGLT